MPSVHDEAGNVDGLPNFALEALASATPVVATRVGGLASAIVDEMTGLLVDERDPGALATALGRLLDDRGLAVALGATGRADVTARFGWPRVAAAVEGAYAQAISRARL